MGAAYQIFGRAVQPHQISIATLSAALLLVIPNPFASAAVKTPKIEASSAEEQKFIEEYINKAEKH